MGQLLVGRFLLHSHHDLHIYMSDLVFDTKEIGFWRKQLLDRNLEKAIKEHPKKAAAFFGAAPAARCNIVQLGMILAAWDLLATPVGKITSIKDEQEALYMIGDLQGEAKEIAAAFCSADNQEKILRNLARSIIKEATGKDLMP